MTKLTTLKYYDIKEPVAVVSDMRSTPIFVFAPGGVMGRHQVAQIGVTLEDFQQDLVETVVEDYRAKLVANLRGTEEDVATTVTVTDVLREFIVERITAWVKDKFGTDATAHPNQQQHSFDNTFIEALFDNSYSVNHTLGLVMRRKFSVVTPILSGSFAEGWDIHTVPADDDPSYITAELQAPNVLHGTAIIMGRQYRLYLRHPDDNLEFNLEALADSVRHEVYRVFEEFDNLIDFGYFIEDVKF